MKKRPFLAPFAIAVAGLLAGVHGKTEAALKAPSVLDQAVESRASSPATDFVLARAVHVGDDYSDHYSHTSHGSHTSHSSHGSGN